MTTQTTEQRIREQLAESIPTIEKHQFRAPAKFDGAAIQHYGFFRADTGNCLPFTARDGYEMTTHEDYAALASAAVDAIGEDGAVKAHWTQSKSMAQATIIVAPSKQARLDGFDTGNGDYVWPRLVIEAPFGRKFSITGGFYRDACRNLCIPRVAGASFQVSLTHTTNLRARMDELVTLCRRANNFDDMLAKMRGLHEIETNVVDFLAKLYPVSESASANTVTRAKNRATAIYSRIHKERLALNRPSNRDGATLWELVGAITGYIQHDKSRKNGIGIVDRAVMALNDTETAAAWALADSMAS